MTRSAQPFSLDVYPPLASRADYERLYRASVEDPVAFWRARADALTWFHAPDAVVSADADGADVTWYAGGKLNACFNAVDRHAAAMPDKTAIVWAANEPGRYQSFTFREVLREVGRIANVLKAYGVRKGDRVCLYLPMVPEAAFAMLACARIGAVHSVVFGGFSAEALRDRILDAGARVVLTADEAMRGARTVPLKSVVDTAVEGLAQVETVLVVRRTGAEVSMREGRDRFLDAECDLQRAHCPVEWMDAEDPLFVLYTSGSTGKPKGVMHTTGGYLVYVALTHRYVFDVKPDDVHFCTADVGWVTGHSYLVYGPLTNGTTTVLFEGVPTYPDAGRLWQVADDLGVTVLYTAPTALRALMGAGDEYVTRYKRTSIRLLGTVGEPINPEVWRWYNEVVGERRCPVVDTWWQTETGGVLISPLPGLWEAKPGSATKPFFGVRPVLVDDDGRVLEGEAAGNLCLGGTWPGQARTLWGNHKQYRAVYFTKFPGMYFTGDGARRDADGDYWVTGRVDDVLNVSAHRLGTAEIESALVAHPAVSEAAVVGVPHAIKGTGIYAYVVRNAASETGSTAELAGALKEAVRAAIGPIATPDTVRVVAALPKTRSGKIMRRILRNIACGQVTALGDLSTLVDPSVVEALIATREEGH